MSQFIQNMVFGTVMFSLLVGLGVAGSGIWFDTYSITPSTEYNSTYNQINGTLERIENLTREASDPILSQGEQTGLNVINSLIKGAFNSILIVKEVFTSSVALMGAILATLQVPAWVIGVLITFILLGIVFSLIFLYIQSR